MCVAALVTFVEVIALLKNNVRKQWRSFIKRNYRACRNFLKLLRIRCQSKRSLHLPDLYHRSRVLRLEISVRHEVRSAHIENTSGKQIDQLQSMILPNKHQQ